MITKWASSWEGQLRTSGFSYQEANAKKSSVRLRDACSRGLETSLGHIMIRWEGNFVWLVLRVSSFSGSLLVRA